MGALRAFRFKFRTQPKTANQPLKKIHKKQKTSPKMD